MGGAGKDSKTFMFDIARAELEVPFFSHMVRQYNLPPDPWAQCMMDYALTVGRLLEQHSIIYEGDTKHQHIDFKGIARGKAALHGLELDTLFKVSQWWSIDRTLERAKLPPLPAWPSIRHWGEHVTISGFALNSNNGNNGGQ